MRSNHSVIGVMPDRNRCCKRSILQQLRALPGPERRLLEAVLIHKHRARLSPRVIPAPRSSLHCFFVTKARIATTVSVSLRKCG